jgi:hypothetical protein
MLCAISFPFLSLSEAMPLIETLYLQYLDNSLSPAKFADMSHARIKYTSIFILVD